MTEEPCDTIGESPQTCPGKVPIGFELRSSSACGIFVSTSGAVQGPEFASGRFVVTQLGKYEGSHDAEKESVVDSNLVRLIR